MVNELYCNPKDEVVIGCFLEKGFNVALNPTERKRKKFNLTPQKHRRNNKERTSGNYLKTFKKRTTREIE